jgi:hypothetical protein
MFSKKYSVQAEVGLVSGKVKFLKMEKFADKEAACNFVDGLYLTTKKMAQDNSGSMHMTGRMKALVIPAANIEYVEYTIKETFTLFG